MYMKIWEDYNNKITKKDLRKQFKIYESQKNLLRRVMKSPEKNRIARKAHSLDTRSINVRHQSSQL